MSDWKRVVGPFVFPLDELYKLSEYRDGAFDEWRDGDTLKPFELLQRREGTKLWYLFLRLLHKLRENPNSEKKEGDGGGGAQVEDEGERNEEVRMNI